MRVKGQTPVTVRVERSMPTPQVSVVIPTRDRQQSLARCLAALTRQTISTQLEIVVVDDGSADAAGTAELVRRTPRARCVRQLPSGVAAARNSGARAALAPVICVTDDDCEPAPDWAARLAAALAAGADAAGGPTVNACPENPLAEATQMIVNYLAERSLESRPISFTPGSNIAFTAEAIRAVPFDERYGPGGEDRDWCTRLIRLGRTLVWEPGAVVLHHQQLTFSSFLRKHVNWGRGAHRFRQAHPTVPRLEVPSFYTRLIGRGFGHSSVAGALVCVAQLATAAGYLEAALLSHGTATPDQADRSP